MIVVCLHSGTFTLIVRTNQFSIPSFLATLLSYPMGIFMAKTLSKNEIVTWGLTWTLNPGPFGVKEHTLIT
jgi:hypothetical protein